MDSFHDEGLPSERTWKRVIGVANPPFLDPSYRNIPLFR